jgi:hypothetical protein
MASTVRDICTMALRKLGVLRAGGEMKAADAEDARVSLQSFYMECVTQGTFGRVFSVVMSAANTVTAGGNQHFNITTEDTVTVDLPSTLSANHWETWRPCRDYGWGLNVPVGADQNVITPRDKSVVMVTNEFADTRATYIYDDTIQRWMRIDTLALTDEAPLSARSVDGLSAVMALRLVDYFGDSLISPATVQAAKQYRVALVTNFGVADDCYC